MMRTLMGALAAACLLSGCTTATLADHIAGAGKVIAAAPTPVKLADQTVLDEQIAIGVELAYQAANLAGRTAINTGLLSAARVRQIAAADLAAKRRVDAARAAYAAGNADSYRVAAREAHAAIVQLIGAAG